MAEDQAKKPKTTLIKHRKAVAKPQVEDEQEKADKKKVVVVKKKVVVVKKHSPKVVVRTEREQSEISESSKTDDKLPVSASGKRNMDESVGADKIAQSKTADSGSAYQAPSPRNPQAPRYGSRDQTRPSDQKRPPSGDRRPYQSNERRSDQSSSTGRSYPPNSGGRPPYGNRPGGPGSQGGRPPYANRSGGPGSQGGRPPYGNRPGGPGAPGERPPYANRSGGPGSQGERPPYGNRPGGPGAPGERPPYGSRPGGPGSQGGRPPYGSRPGGPGSQGGRPPYGSRSGGPGSQGGRPPYGSRPGGPGGAGKKPGPSRDSGEAAAEKKAPGKKFFKAKKKNSYQKNKREEHSEKVITSSRKKQIMRANPIPKEIDIMEVVTVSELARKMNLKASELISKLMSMGVMATINQQIDAETATILAQEYSCKVKIISLYDETIIESEVDSEGDLRPRPPIVTVMGHVDHGKTKLLDAIRTSNVVDSEFGGITQHIGAYMVEANGRKICFLDTPGHEAFTLMRARGAQITDLVILVVAANDGVMPQTVEAVNHAKDAGVPIIVAINKIDLPEANVDRIKQQLSEYNLIPEDWGGTTMFTEISALKKTGIDDLLENINLQAEILELKANYTSRAEGKVIESKIDPGRGVVSTVLIERGTLSIGDAFIAGIFPGKVRAMYNERGQKVDTATPATPVEIIGFTGIPNSGDPFQVTESEKLARQVGSKRQELKKVEEAKNVHKITLDNLYDSITEGATRELKVIIKGDVHGSVEALQTALEKLSTKEIRLVVIHASAGAINERDVMLASASNAIVIGFHVRPTPKALSAAEQEKVEIRKYNIIYDAVNDIKSAMEGLLSPELREETVGTVEVRDVFKVPKIGLIAGCYVTSGKVKRGAKVHIIREGVEVYSGSVTSLKRFKDDAKEVDANYECGIGIDNYQDIKVGDQFEVFEIKEYAKKLAET